MWVRTCQECGHKQQAHKPNQAREMTDAYANARCRKCKSEGSFDYGKGREVTTFRDALRSNVASNAKSENEKHTCVVCQAIDLAVTEERPVCPPCSRQLRATTITVARQAETSGGRNARD